MSLKIRKTKLKNEKVKVSSIKPSNHPLFNKLNGGTPKTKSNIMSKKKKAHVQSKNRLEDVDDITLEEYKQSEVNTLKRLRDHVFEGGDEFDNFDILEGDIEEPELFQFDSNDLASTELLNDEQIFQLRKKHKKNNIIQESATDKDETMEKEREVKVDNASKTKMSKKEKDKIKLEKKLAEARRIQFKVMPKIKKVFWKDSLKNLTAEDHRDMRIKLKAKVDNGDNDNTIIPRPVLSFDDDDLPKSMIEYLEFLQKKYQSNNFSTPTPVQSQAWSCILTGADVLTIAQTGSGKTLGYILPAIPHILHQMNVRKELANSKRNSHSQEHINTKGPVVLVIVPTRELAQQVESSCKPLRSRFGIHSLSVFGGVKSTEQKDILSNQHNEIIIATPGRLVDLINNSKETVGLLGGVTMLVLDEADRMLQMGFGDQLQKISEQIRPDRQTLMFSATFPQPMQEAARKWLDQRNYLKIRVKSSAANQESTAVVSKNVKQVIKVLKDNQKIQHLHSFLKNVIEKESAMRNKSLILIFVNQIKSVRPIFNSIENLLKAEKKLKIRCGCMHGDMKQNERDQAVADFKSGKVSILVATDILGRGIHINNLRFVINYDFPTSLEQYIHRVGRTGRQGNKGHSLTYFVESPSNSPMSKGLIKILQECDQQVSKELQAISDSYHGVSEEVPKDFIKEEDNEDDEVDDEDDESENNDSNDDEMSDDDENDEDYQAHFEEIEEDN